uniref:Cytochrome c oxidase subunit 2 n=1 Tax=Derotettix mendosensis TaxID=2219932 RepID=A0A3Q8G8H9_9HEMI|nr:cytochrome oxidase subunit II [Derotettix mendosensis]
MSNWSQIVMQDANSPMMEQLVFFHDHALMILIIIMIIVSYMTTSLFFNKMINRMLLEGQMIELIWTILPAIVLIFIALPSLRLLYLLDEVSNPSLSIKIVGHQWYWSYEYSDFFNVEFDSYMKSPTNLLINDFRLLDVDNRTIVPFGEEIRLIITSSDVLHSWAVPSLGIKVDAVPGRLNQSGLHCMRPGIMYGQCSEICGANHSFMPIVIESIDMVKFMNWLSSY